MIKPIAFPTRPDLDSSLSQERLPGATGIPAPAIGMVEQSGCGMSPHDRRVQSLLDSLLTLTSVAI